MELMTTQVARWRLARERKVVFIDTTAKSGARANDLSPIGKDGRSIFAPTWDIVMGIKRGEISEEQYTAEYHRLMRQSWIDNKDAWMEFMQRGEVQAIACYCPPGEFCHRHLLKNILEKLCEAKDIPFAYYGELTE